MSNLFITFTPFQLFVAQQIINQEKLNNNILIEGYVQYNHHFIQIYDMMKINDMWDNSILFPEISYWDGITNRTIKDNITAYNNYKRLCKIVEEYDIDTIYMGEIQNTSIRLLDVIFDKKGIKTVFFEEGSSHYVNRTYNENITLKLKIKILLRDLFYYLPIFGVKFAKWRYIPNYPSTNLPMYRRYSIVPYYNECFDIRLYPTELFSDRISEFLKQEIGNEQDRVLLLTDPLAELIGKDNIKYYLEVIEECFKMMSQDLKIYIKYHPRDPIETRNEVIKLANKYQLNYKILSKNINIPVEYYLQKYDFKYIWVFNASTFFYNGYIFKKQNFKKLLPRLYEKLEKNSFKNNSFLKTIIMRMEEISLH